MQYPKVTNPFSFPSAVNRSQAESTPYNDFQPQLVEAHRPVSRSQEATEQRRCVRAWIRSLCDQQRRCALAPIASLTCGEDRPDQVGNYSMFLPDRRILAVESDEFGSAKFIRDQKARMARFPCHELFLQALQQLLGLYDNVP